MRCTLICLQGVYIHVTRQLNLLSTHPIIYSKTLLQNKRTKKYSVIINSEIRTFSKIKPKPICFLQAYSVLSEAKQEDEKKREKLLTLYEEADLQMKKLDKKTLDLLEEYVGNFEERMKIQKERLKCKEYVLLVAGNWLINKIQLWATTLFSL